MSDNGMSKHDHVLAGLVFSLQAMAMQQLGKLQDPHSGELHRDLDQARGTIDILEMLKAKCRTDTPPDLLRMIDGAVMDLQLNYLDERKKDAHARAAADEAEPAAPADAAEASGDDADEDPERRTAGRGGRLKHLVAAGLLGLVLGAAPASAAVPAAGRGRARGRARGGPARAARRSRGHARRPSTRTRCAWTA